MSFKRNEKMEQITLDDSFYRLSARNQKIVLGSWAKDFAEIVFPAINEERFSVLYSDNAFSRPNTPVNIIVGALILKENGGLSDGELMESICCDVRYQYALHTTHLAEQPISDRTFSRFRERLYKYEQKTGRDLLAEEMKSLTDCYAKYMNLYSNIRRMDSLMVATHSKRMSRLEIIYQVNSNAVSLLHKLGADELIGQELLHYLASDDLNEVIYYCKGEDVQPRLEKALLETDILLKMMQDEQWHGYEEYQLLVRVANEQGKRENGRLVPRENREITPCSLQNPSDPDATYRKKAGKDYKGYTANLVEEVGKDGDGLIVDVAFASNQHSDSAFLKEYLESRGEEAETETLIADGAYGGKANQELAEEKNVKLVTTALTGVMPEEIFTRFEMSEDGKSVQKCPAGFIPLKSKYHEKNESCRTVMPKDCCANCRYREYCHAKEQAKSWVVHVSKTKIARAHYIQKLSSDEYKELTKKRNAIEGVMSVLRRRYRVDDIPVFGYIQAKLFFRLKVAAYNFNKLLKYCRRSQTYCVQNQKCAG